MGKVVSSTRGVDHKQTGLRGEGAKENMDATPAKSIHDIEQIRSGLFKTAANSDFLQPT